MFSQAPPYDNRTAPDGGFTFRMGRFVAESVCHHAVAGASLSAPTGAAQSPPSRLSRLAFGGSVIQLSKEVDMRADRLAEVVKRVAEAECRGAAD